MIPERHNLPALRCWAEIDLAALERNIRLIRASLAPHIRYVAVVKADAYGHGLPQTAARLMHAGVDVFAVANVTEAAAIRELGPGWPILVLSPLLPNEDRALVAHDLTATVSSAEEVRRFEALGRAAGKPVSVHLKIDTGMGRAGVWHEEVGPVWAALREAVPHVRVDGIYTHFSSPDEDPVFTAEQRTRLIAAISSCEGIDASTLLVHADNSAGLETRAAAGPFNAVRVGLLQFGILPHPHSLLSEVHTEPVFSFHTRVALVKRLPVGTDISYGRTFTLAQDSTVAILAAGYGDGLPRAASNRGAVLLHGRRCPILGRVTMDQTIVDISDVSAVQVGDEAVMVGRQGNCEITLSEFSQAADTIPWETLTSVTKRVPRVYRTALGL